MHALDGLKHDIAEISWVLDELEPKEGEVVIIISASHLNNDLLSVRSWVNSKPKEDVEFICFERRVLNSEILHCVPLHFS